MWLSPTLEAKNRTYSLINCDFCECVRIVASFIDRTYIHLSVFIVPRKLRVYLYCTQLNKNFKTKSEWFPLCNGLESSHLVLLFGVCRCGVNWGSVIKSSAHFYTYISPFFRFFQLKRKTKKLVDIWCGAPDVGSAPFTRHCHACAGWEIQDRNASVGALERS